MVTEPVQTAIFWFEFLTGIALILIILRIAYVIGLNPVGEVAEEILYLRVGDLKVPALFIFFALVLEMVEFLQPLLAMQGVFGILDTVAFYMNAVQALLLLASGILVVLVFQRYTQRGLTRRIRESMDTIAYLAGQQRRRRGRGGGGGGKGVAPAEAEEESTPRREK